MQLTENRVSVVARAMNQAFLMERAVAVFHPTRKAKKPTNDINVFEDAMQALKTMAHEEDITIAVVGGAATAYHGYARSTKDIDVAVDSADFQKIIKVCYKYGFKIKSYNPAGMHELEYKGVPIEVLEEGMFHYDPQSARALPKPQNMGVSKGFGFADLKSWIRLKLVGGRSQDQADVVRVLDKVSDTQLSEIKQYLQDLDVDLYDDFERLKYQAQQENKRAATLIFPRR